MNLGYCLHQGVGVKSNGLRSVECFKEAAHQGDGVDQFSYGLCCYRGEGILKAFTEASEYFKLSADQGFIPGFCVTASGLVNHRIDYGGLSSVAFCAGCGRDLSERGNENKTESEKGENTWKEYQRADRRLRLKGVDCGN
jgi:hypothetical protein